MAVAVSCCSRTFTNPRGGSIPPWIAARSVEASPGRQLIKPRREGLSRACGCRKLHHAWSGGPDHADHPSAKPQVNVPGQVFGTHRHQRASRICGVRPSERDPLDCVAAPDSTSLPECPRTPAEPGDQPAFGTKSSGSRSAITLRTASGASDRTAMMFPIRRDMWSPLSKSESAVSLRTYESAHPSAGSATEEGRP